MNSGLYLIVSALLVLAWIPLWTVGRHVRFWFLVAGTAGSVLCIAAGFAAPGAGPVYLWANGLFGLFTCLVLVVLTLAVDTVLGLVRRLTRRVPPARAGGGAASRAAP